MKTKKKFCFIYFQCLFFLAVAQRIKPSDKETILNKGLYFNVQVVVSQPQNISFDKVQNDYFRKLPTNQLQDKNLAINFGYKFYRHSIEIGIALLPNPIGAEFNSGNPNDWLDNLNLNGGLRIDGAVYISLRYSYKILNYDKLFNIEVSFAFTKINFGDTLNKLPNPLFPSIPATIVKQLITNTYGFEFGVKPTYRMSHDWRAELFINYTYSPTVVREVKFNYRGFENQLQANSSLINFGLGLTYNF